MPLLGPRLTVGAIGPSYQLRDADGRAFELSDLWAERPTALVFLRHFG